MIVCDKCRCREVCALKNDYINEVEEAKARYIPGNNAFELTIRCHQYIPDKKKTEERR